MQHNTTRPHPTNNEPIGIKPINPLITTRKYEDINNKLHRQKHRE